MVVSIIAAHEHRTQDNRKQSFYVQDVNLTTLTVIESNGNSNSTVDSIDSPLQVTITLKSSHGDVSRFNESIFDNVFVALFTEDVYIVPEVTPILPNTYLLKARLESSGQYKIVARLEWVGWPDSRQKCLENTLDVDRRDHTLTDARLMITMNSSRSIYKHDRYCSPVESFIGSFYASRDHLIPSSGRCSLYMTNSTSR